MYRLPLVLLAITVGLSACSKNEQSAASNPTSDPAAPPAGQAMAPNTARVLQAQQAAGYTYAEVDLGDGRTAWVAGGPIQIKAGDMVQWRDYSIMENFYARSLDRTFPQIFFVNAWGPVGADAVGVAPHGTPLVGPGMAMPAPMPAPTPNTPMAKWDGATAAGAEMHQGTVRSVKNTGDYSYIEVDRNGTTVWVATTPAAVKAGDKLRWNSDMVMRNFEAKALGRTFDQVVFADHVEVIR